VLCFCIEKKIQHGHTFCWHNLYPAELCMMPQTAGKLLKSVMACMYGNMLKQGGKKNRKNTVNLKFKYEFERKTSFSHFTCFFVLLKTTNGNIFAEKQIHYV
jgi:hypothetical protein